MHLDGATLFAPEALFHELHPEITSFDYSWSIVNDAKKTDYVGAELKNIVASHSNIALDEINTVIEYEEMTNSFAFGSMEILSWLVFLFGVINLINTTLSNQIARKQENSILRSIGLTQKQLCKMTSPRKGGEKMEAIPRNDGEQYRFDAFCKAVLRNEARNRFSL